MLFPGYCSFGRWNIYSFWSDFSRTADQVYSILWVVDLFCLVGGRQLVFIDAVNRSKWKGFRADGSTAKQTILSWRQAISIAFWLHDFFYLVFIMIWGTFLCQSIYYANVQEMSLPSNTKVLGQQKILF